MTVDLRELVERLTPEERHQLFTTLRAKGPPGAPDPRPPDAQPDGPSDALAAPLRGENATARFSVVHKVGAGGMGAVYRVRDGTLLRESAMKVLAPDLADKARFVNRFLGEAQIQAQLEHPNIVPVHELAVGPDGVPYFTMRLLRGTTLGAWIRRASAAGTLADSSHDMLLAFLKVCDAVAFAHDRGVIHGDLTPENVVVEPFGAVYVVDWGLARLLPRAREDGATVAISAEAWNAVATREIAGTPAFMSPEQARGRSDLCDERTDVFGLGAILHTIVTGRSPHASLVGDAGLPVPVGLARVVDRALASNQDERHQSALVLKGEVERFLRGGMAWPLVQYPAGSTIVREGEPGDAAFVVVHGRCLVYKTVQGRRSVLREMGPGAVFGETAVFSPGPRTASIEALTDVVARVVTRPVLEEGLGLDGAVGAFVKALAERFRELDASLQASLHR